LKEENEKLKAEIRFLNGELQEKTVALQKMDKESAEYNEVVKANDALRKQVSKLEGQVSAFAKLKEAFADFLPTVLPSTVFTANGNGKTVGLQTALTIVDVPTAEKLVTISTENMRGKILAVARKGKLDTWRQLNEIVKAVEDEHWNASSQEVNNALNDLEKQDLIAKKHSGRNYYCLAQGVRFKEADS
jgi:hypothetical protein